MASTYALSVNSATHAHSHGRSRSHYTGEQLPSWNGSINGTSPMKNPNPHLNTGHSHHRSDMSGQPVPSPYADSQDYFHEHSAERSRSIDSTFKFKPLMGGRPRGRPRGESDLGRPPSRKSVAGANFGFDPIEEAPAPPSKSWVELPEALTALLIPLPYLFASLAYPSVIAQYRRLSSPLSHSTEQHLDIAAMDTRPPSLQTLPNRSPLLHASTLSSTTLILISIISKIRTILDQPLDRRKSFGSSEQNNIALDILWEPSSVVRILTNILSVLLPYYAAMQLGGAKTSLVLLAATAGGLGALDKKPGKHSPWDALKRTFRTRKATIGTVLLVLLLDVLNSSEHPGTLLGHLALTTSILAIPPPLPMTGWSLKTDLKTGTDSRMSLPRASSPLVNTHQDTLLTFVAGVILTVIAIFSSIISSTSPSTTHHAILFSTCSVASVAALVFFSFPSALRSQKKLGLVLGSVLIGLFGLWQSSTSWESWVFFPLTCASIVGAVLFDTASPFISRPHSHSHSHSGHKHHHEDHDHHLHGHHSKVSQFLIAQCTPGSVVHSIMIEKDSRRIAYFAVLNLAFMLIQFFYGFVSGSLGLLTDSIHMLFDCAGLAVGLAAAVMSKWPPNSRFPYGYGKIDTLSGFANGVFLMLVSVEIIFDAFERLWEGHELHRLNELLIVSILGFVVNIVGLTAFGHAHHGHGHSHDHGHGDHDHTHGHSHENENMQGIFLHILADTLGSVAVIISTLLAKFYGWSGWDPIASCIISVLIFGSAVPLVKSSGMRLLLSLPADVEYGIRNALQELSSLRGVVGYTVPRFWLEDEGAAHSEVHAKSHGDSDDEHGHCEHDHGHEHTHNHASHPNGSAHSHHDHEHSHDGHNHNHFEHDHSHGPRKQKVLGVIHIQASRAANLEDVRERTVQFLRGRGMDVVVHAEHEGEGRCWCGGGNKVA
ncbi:hypothetical protein CC78DRAFT_558830 [Lojkania enalia]|uniref:Zinc transporter n=1 Tax=Lojkania enalia TaxID=147567 RepID=A0A9P4KIV0_9PLEO|nr:hypothetical protein CC78DRAFT_558830 [Didymosphaeria enalia]